MDDVSLFTVLNFIRNNDFPLNYNPKYLHENIGFKKYLSIISI